MQNPYQAPQAHVEDVSGGGEYGTLIEGGRKVDAGNAMAWISGGWTLFKQAPAIWIVNIIIFGILYFITALIPILNIILPPLLIILLMGGLMIGCRALDDGEPFTVGHLFAGLQQHATPLLIVGVAQIVLTIGLMLIIGAMMAVFIGGSVATGMMGGMMGGEGAARMFAGGFGLMMVVVVLLAVLIGMAIYSVILFAPVLVVLHDLAPMDAMKASFSGFWKNFLGFLIFGLVSAVLALIGMIPLLLGLLVVYPVIVGAIYAAYKDIYLEA